MQQCTGGKTLSISLMLALASVALQPEAAQAQWAAASSGRSVIALAPAYQGGDWRQQVRVASPYRNARWNSAPAGAVRVYNRRFDSRWQWRSAPRHHVVYTYYRGDMWFLDPTTGWAYSVDRYGIVYTADPYRGWVYSLGPLTRWTADLLYFFDLYRFDRGYWYCRDYDYFVDLWDDYPRYGAYTYDTAYTTLWGWEPYFSSPTFISYSNQFSVVWVGQVRSHYRYIERNPYYRRELIDNIGLPAVQAAPPRTISPRAVATTAYWEARDLAAAGMAPPPRGRDAGQGLPNPNYAAGTVIDARQTPSQVVEAGAPAPGFNAPFPDGSYGFGVRPADGRGGAAGPAENGGGMSADSGRGRDASAEVRAAESGGAAQAPAAVGSETYTGNGSEADAWKQPMPATAGERDRSGGDQPPQFEEPSYPPSVRSESAADERAAEPVFDAPRAADPVYAPEREPERTAPVFEQPREEAPQVDDSQYQRARDEPRYEAPREEPRYEAPPREEPRYEAPPREEPRYEAPREEPRYEAPPREEPRYEAPPREEPRYEAPREEKHDEPRAEDDGGERERQEQ